MVCSFSVMPAFSNRLTLLMITMIFTEHRCFVDDFEDKDDHDWDSGLEGQRDLATEEDHHDDCNDRDPGEDDHDPSDDDHDSGDDDHDPGDDDHDGQPSPVQ